MLTIEVSKPLHGPRAARFSAARAGSFEISSGATQIRTRGFVVIRSITTTTPDGATRVTALAGLPRK